MKVSETGFWGLGLWGRAALLLALGMSFAQIASAAPVPERVMLRAIDAALAARDAALVDVSSENIRATSQKTMNDLVRRGISALRSEGYFSLARKKQTEWDRSGFSGFFTQQSAFAPLDLGDHRPLSDWLARFYLTLEGRLGSKVVYSGLLGDIYNLNYAIPVVFKPKGEWRTNSLKRDSIEYRKHFIPLANVVTYWGSYAACLYVMNKYGAAKEGKKVCQTVSDRLRFVMGRYVGAKVSDYVFARANGVNGRLEISASDLRYVSAAQLAREIQSDLARANGGA